MKKTVISSLTTSMIHFQLTVLCNGLGFFLLWAFTITWLTKLLAIHRFIKVEKRSFISCKKCRVVETRVAGMAAAKTVFERFTNACHNNIPNFFERSTIAYQTNISDPLTAMLSVDKKKQEVLIDWWCNPFKKSPIQSVLSSLKSTYLLLL